jgi:hypothetical protein
MSSEAELARGRVDGAPIHVGDQVMVRAVVCRSVAGVGALVRFTSKTEQYDGWIAEDDLRFALVDNELPAEPEDNTWLYADGSMFPDGNSRIFHRDDREGHYDEDRRFQQHWFDLTGDGWIDWPAAVERGAGRIGVRRMVVLAEDQTDVDIAALDEAMNACWMHGKWKWMTQKMQPAVREAAAAAVERYHERIDPDEPVTTSIRWWDE